MYPVIRDVMEIRAQNTSVNLLTELSVPCYSFRRIYSSIDVRAFAIRQTTKRVLNYSVSALQCNCHSTEQQSDINLNYAEIIKGIEDGTMPIVYTSSQAKKVDANDDEREIYRLISNSRYKNNTLDVLADRPPSTKAWKSYARK